MFVLLLYNWLLVWSFSCTERHKLLQRMHLRIHLELDLSETGSSRWLRKSNKTGQKCSDWRKGKRQTQWFWFSCTRSAACVFNNFSWISFLNYLSICLLNLCKQSWGRESHSLATCYGRNSQTRTKANVQPWSKISSSYLWTAGPYSVSSPAKQSLTSLKQWLIFHETRISLYYFTVYKEKRYSDVHTQKVF